MYLIIKPELYLDNKIVHEVKRFNTLKQAVAYLLKENSLSEDMLVKEIKEFEVIEKD